MKTTIFVVLMLSVAGWSQSVARGVTLTGVTLDLACGPPLYACSSVSTANPGNITALFSSRAPTGTVNTQNASSGSCPSNCVLQQTGDNFSTLLTGNPGSGNGQITINGTNYSVSMVYSSTLLGLSSAPGTQTGVTFTAPTGCVGISSAGTGSGCLGSTAHDVTLNPAAFNCVSRLTDGSVIWQGQSAIGTSSGGDNDLMFSANEDFFAYQEQGGFIAVISVAPNAAGCLIATSPSVGSAPAIRITRPFAFDWQNDAVFYNVSGSTLQQYTISNVNTLPTPTALINFAGAGVCPGVDATSAGSIHGSLLPSWDGQTFGVLAGTGIQNTWIWTLFYNRTLGCAAVNWQTGTVWGWCTGGGCSPSTTPLGTFGTAGDICWGANPNASTGGIHDGALSPSANYYVFSLNGTWTQGKCAGNADATQTISYQLNSLNNSWADGEAVTTYGWYDNHPSPGFTYGLSNIFRGPNYRPLGNLGGGFVQFLGATSTNDIHQSWIHPNGDDTFPSWVGATDSATAAMASPCANATQCPTWPNNMVVAHNIYAPYPPGTQYILFTHTYACAASGGGGQLCPDGLPDYFAAGNAIGTTSPKGHYFAWTSCMLHATGTDNNANPRCDEYAVQTQ